MPAEVEVGAPKEPGRGAEGPGAPGGRLLRDCAARAGPSAWGGRKQISPPPPPKSPKERVVAVSGLWRIINHTLPEPGGQKPSGGHEASGQTLPQMLSRPGLDSVGPADPEEQGASAQGSERPLPPPACELVRPLRT